MFTETRSTKKSLAYRISEWNRAKKFQLFLRTISPKDRETILDVGVNDEEYSESDNYLEKHYPFPKQITAVAMGSLEKFRSRYPDTRAIEADGRNLPFKNDEFSISVSNAVLEHVWSRNQQLKFLLELTRVARRGFFTTPNRLFPIEVHTRIPLLHLILSKKYFDFFLSRIGKSWATGTYMNLLSFRELDALCKEANIPHFRILRNRFLGFTITFSVVWQKDTIPDETL